MYIPAASRPELRIPVYPPAGTDLGAVPVQLAFMPDDGTEPADADWVTAAWADDSSSEAVLVIGPDTATVLAPGEYMVWVALASGEARPVLPSGRLRVGDPRT